MLTGTPGHLSSFDYLGLHRYSLTYCTIQRRKTFTTQEVVSLVLAQISRTATENQFDIIVYCFMPDHLHLLVEGTSRQLRRQAVYRATEAVPGYYYSAAYHEKLWQRYGFEHVLRDDEITMVVAKYILENPIRAGLVERVEDYPFVGSMVYSLAELLEGVACGSG